MTEKTKSALEVLGTYDMSDDNDDTEFKDAISLAISSLEAWDEVLYELQHTRSASSETFNQGIMVAEQIINQKLAEIEEVR